MRFEAKLDDLSKSISFVTLGVLLIPAVLIINMAAHGEPKPLSVISTVLIILFLAYSYAVKAYELDETELKIYRMAGVKKFKLADLASATPVTTKELGFGLRAFGSGGFFGYFGSFVYRNIGKAQVFATDKSKFILLKTKAGKNIIVSPADTVEFLNALKLPTAAID
jgi:hypothetical protein